MSKFEQSFKEWFMFSDGHTFVISAEAYTKEQALDELKKDILTWPKYRAVRVTVDDLKDDRVRYCFGSYENYDDPDLGHVPMWWLGSKGKGSKPVYVIDMWNTSNFNQNKIESE